MELTERKKKVLRSIVDLYIRTAEKESSAIHRRSVYPHRRARWLQGHRGTAGHELFLRHHPQ